MSEKSIRTESELFELLFQEYYKSFQSKVVSDNYTFGYDFHLERDHNTGVLYLYKEDNSNIIIYCDPFWAYNEDKKSENVDEMKFYLSEDYEETTKSYPFIKTFNLVRDSVYYYNLIEDYIIQDFENEYRELKKKLGK